MTFSCGKDRWSKHPNIFKLFGRFKLLLYSIGVQHGDSENWDYLWDVYAKNLTINAHEKRNLLSALCATTNEKKITFLLNEALEGNTIRSQVCTPIFFFNIKRLMSLFFVI